MTHEARVRAVAALGFTDRQARFLTLVILAGGVCAPKQYAHFAGIAYGHKVNVFLDKLVSRGLAIKSRCVHNRACLYHVNGRPLWEAIGVGRSVARRTVPINQAVARVMRLDGVLALPDTEWLLTEPEKVEILTALAPTLAPESWPHAQVGTHRRLFPDNVLIGLDADARPVFLHLVLDSFGDEVRQMLQRYGALLAALHQWTVRLLVPKRLAAAIDDFRAAFREELTTPLTPAVMDELRWYFDQRRSSGRGRRSWPRDPRFRRAQDAFAGMRFRVLYHRWLTDGERAFDIVVTDRIAAHLASDTGRLDCAVLPCSYDHLAPLVDPPRLIREGPVRVEERDKQGDEGSARPQPRKGESALSLTERMAADWRALNEFYNQQARLRLSREGDDR